MAFSDCVKLSGVDTHYWIRGTFTTPSAEDNSYLVLQTCYNKQGPLDPRTPQGILYLNGEMVLGFDNNHAEAYLEPDTTYEMYHYLYTGMDPGDDYYFTINVVRIDRAVEKLYYDFLVPFEINFNVFIFFHIIPHNQAQCQVIIMLNRVKSKDGQPQPMPLFS